MEDVSPAQASSQRPAKPSRASRRSTNACRRCNAHKIKCSGGQPCRGCQNSLTPADCVYTVRSRKVQVLDTYLKQLQEENRLLKANQGHVTRSEQHSETSAELEMPLSPAHTTINQVSRDSREASPPIFEASATDESHVYIGDAACAAYSARIRHVAKGGAPRADKVPARFFAHPALNRQRSSTFDIKLPSRTYAKILVRVVARFVGLDYHFMRMGKFMENVEELYRSPAKPNVNFLARFFGILALGELYSKKSATTVPASTVPGTAFFLQAVALLEDRQEDGDVEYIETLLTLSFYSLALNRKKTAYAYVGTALRLSLALGLHRDAPHSADSDVEDIENRRRVWWTVYTYDRMLTSKLGFPLTIRDEDIDLPLPSECGPDGHRLNDFVDPSHLLASIKLSQITGAILENIYSLPAPKRGIAFVRNVQEILVKLRDLDHGLPAAYQTNILTTPTQPRHISSLRLHFNQCIVLTTRPILLHVFRFDVHIKASSAQKPAPPSPTISALAEACISSARQSHKILTQLWIDGSLATFGYFDAHYLFSSLIILLMSYALYQQSEDSDSIETGEELLRSMSEDGNTPASEYLERLRLLKQDLGVPDRSQGVTQQRDPDEASMQAAAAANPVDMLMAPLFTGAPLDDPQLRDFLLYHSNGWSPGVMGMATENMDNWDFSTMDWAPPGPA